MVSTLIIDYIMSTKKLFSLIDVDHCIILYIIEGKLIFKIKLVIATHASWIPSKVFLVVVEHHLS